jgi:HSP20 family molecular chaperone IbpA
MINKNILTISILSLSLSTLNAELDLQKSMYDAADEMMRMDEKMNRAIAEHNQIDPAEDEVMRLHAMTIEDFEETKDGYKLEQSIENPEHTKVEVSIEEDLIIITTTSVENEVDKNELNITKTMTMSSSSVSLLIPNDADKNKMEKSYENGLLKINFPKK